MAFLRERGPYEGGKDFPELSPEVFSGQEQVAGLSPGAWGNSVLPSNLQVLSQVLGFTHLPEQQWRTTPCLTSLQSAPQCISYNLSSQNHLLKC